MVLKEWADLPVSIRSSRRKLWNYLVDELNEDPDPTPVVETSTVTATVTDGDSGISGITVTLTDTTDNSKTYTGTSITGGTATIAEVPYGEYSVTASGEGYEAYTAQSNLTVDGETETLEIVMTAIPTTTDIAVSVTIKDSETPVEGATVLLTDVTDNTKTFTGTTGSEGGCTLSNVTFSTYIVTATCTGYENYTAESNLTVTAETTTLSIGLTASTPAQEEVPGGE